MQRTITLSTPLANRKEAFSPIVSGIISYNAAASNRIGSLHYRVPEKEA